jgi:hypothetical protein
VSVVLPSPVPLPHPPGEPAALGRVVDELTSAGFAAGLTVHLLEPAAVLSGWQGADAAVAADEVGAAIAVAAELHEALAVAGARLADHHELWLAVRSGVARLRDQQRAEFADADARLAVLVGTSAETGMPGIPSPEAFRLVAAVTERDAGRAAEHRALLKALDEDATGTAAALSAAARPFSTSGPTGDVAAITARLAVRLPGWGAGALASLGVQAADDLARPGPSGQLDAAVERWRSYASLPGFAEGFVGRLGIDGVTWLLAVLGERAGTDESDSLAALLAGALGGSDGQPGERVGEVLADLRLDPADPGAALDGIAIGMGAVLSAPGAGPTLAAVWGGQALAWEEARGVRAPAGAAGGALLPDPVGAAVAVLARAGDPAAAARLLERPGAWTTLLSRSWPGGTGELAAVVGLAAAAPAAAQAARSALLALGQGLTPGNGTSRVLDDQIALARVRPEVTGLVAGQTDVLLPVLDAASTGAALDAAADTALRGLGYLVADPAAARKVTTAVRAALQAGGAGAFAGEVAGAHVAVLEYGQRLRYALAWSHAKSEAVDAQMVWTPAVSVPVSLIPGPAGDLAGVLEDVLADALDADGDVELGPDTGRVRTDDDAARFAVGALGPAAPAGAEVPPGAAARVGFQRAGRALGTLAAPAESPLDRLGDLPVPDLSRWPRRGE